MRSSASSLSSWNSISIRLADQDFADLAGGRRGTRSRYGRCQTGRRWRHKRSRRDQSAQTEIPSPTAPQRRTRGRGFVGLHEQALASECEPANEWYRAIQLIVENIESLKIGEARERPDWSRPLRCRSLGQPEVKHDAVPRETIARHLQGSRVHGRARYPPCFRAAGAGREALSGRARHRGASRCSRRSNGALPCS